MGLTRISGRSAILGQLTLLILLLPLAIFFSYMMIRYLTVDKIPILLIFDTVVFLIVRNGFSYFDIYDAGDKLVIKNAFYKKSISKDQVKDVDAGILSTTFCLILNDGSKFYFQSSIFDFFKSSNDVLSSLKDKTLPKNTT
ncbi:hypothetical protein [Pedobacter sp.]|jgi:hypothetical protein|uniref:hypothetical protein n=1 Tax=Pedobacter sp. TaxID=1411316 RepID=UPI002B602006|nr:hypothetical protein [Pedobacter sp.]HWW38553.1 hypothetical protein [Pedobacter sp.]